MSFCFVGVKIHVIGSRAVFACIASECIFHKVKLPQPTPVVLLSAFEVSVAQQGGNGLRRHVPSSVNSTITLPALESACVNSYLVQRREYQCRFACIEQTDPALSSRWHPSNSFQTNQNWPPAGDTRGKVVN